jgi:hypothetical protein
MVIAPSRPLLVTLEIGEGETSEWLASIHGRRIV